MFAQIAERNVRQRDAREVVAEGGTRELRLNFFLAFVGRDEVEVRSAIGD